MARQTEAGTLDLCQYVVDMYELTDCSVALLLLVPFDSVFNHINGVSF
jgi:hypothetical protein